MIEIWGTPIIAEIEDVVDLLVIELRGSGSHFLKDRKSTHRNIMLTCINHKDGMEATPSMGILTEDVNRDGREYKAGSVNCFVCGYTVDLPEFISNSFGHRDAGYFGFKWITSNFVNLSVENRKDLKIDMSRNASSDAQIDVLSDEELDSYRYTHPYMYERKLTDKVIEYFDVGYDGKTQCLTFPVHDLRGDPLFLQRRAVSGKRFQNDVTTLKGSVLYGLYHVYRNLTWIKELYVTESIIDALTLWTYRIAAVATMQAIPTTTQLDLLKKAPVRHIICAQDDDKAGDDGAKRIKDKIGDVKIISRLDFPYEINPLTGKTYKDVNEFTEDHMRNLSCRLL